MEGKIKMVRQGRRYGESREGRERVDEGGMEVAGKREREIAGEGIGKGESKERNEERRDRDKEWMKERTRKGMR